GPVIDEIVRLGEGYSIVTEYTSFLVLENDAEFKRWNIQRRNALRIDRDRAARASLREEIEQLRRKSVADLGPGAPLASASNDAAASSDASPVLAQRPVQQPAGRSVDLDIFNGGG